MRTFDFGGVTVSKDSGQVSARRSLLYDQPVGIG
jgi:hypothetical protein